MRLQLDASKFRIDVSEGSGGYHARLGQLIGADANAGDPGSAAEVSLILTVGDDELVVDLTDLQLALLGRVIDGYAQSVVGPRGIWETSLNPDGVLNRVRLQPAGLLGPVRP